MRFYVLAANKRSAVTQVPTEVVLAANKRSSVTQVPAEVALYIPKGATSVSLPDIFEMPAGPKESYDIPPRSPGESTGFASRQCA